MTYLIEFIFTILLLILHQETGSQVTPVDQPVKGLATKIPNTTVPLVYMANTSITVGEIGLYYVPITILRSEAVPYGSYVYLDLSYDDRRYAYLQNTSPYISAYSTNITTNLYVDERSDMFFTQPSIFNVSIYSCDYDCNVGLPRSTIIFVKPERNVTLSFYNDYVYGAECDCDGCCYDYIEIRSSRELSENMVITLLTGSNDTAIYNVDYSFDKQFVEAQPAMNLSTYSQYHYTGIYIKRDGLLEGTEYFHLRFDNASLPDRVFAASPAELTFEIRDGDYGFIRINDSYRHVSEDVRGTVDLIIETNIIQPYKNLTLNVTMGYGYYSYYSESATPGEDYVPFDGFYVIPPGASSIVIPITIIDDDLAESEETFSFQVEAYYEGTDNYYTDGGSIYIEDDETRNTPLLFSFDTKSVTVNESSGTLDFYVTANIKNEGYVYLQYLPAEENGLLEYQDYTAYFNLTIKQEVFQFDKDTEYKIEVNILNDCDIEMTEMMVLNISAVSIGQTDPENYNLTIIVEDNDAEGDLNCLACSCGSGVWPTKKPTSEPEPEPLMFNFELNEFEIYEGECSFYDIDVVATRPTNATVFLAIQPWELEYGEDFTISAKKLVFENNDRQNFSFRALQDTLDEDVESVLISIAYASDGIFGRRNAILVHVFNEKVTESEANSRSARSIDGSSLEETRSEEFKSTAITTGLVAGLVSSLLVVMVTTILFGAAVVMRKPKQSLKS